MTEREETVRDLGLKPYSLSNPQAIFDAMHEISARIYNSSQRHLESSYRAIKNMKQQF
jgi:hypothetical protein